MPRYVILEHDWPTQHWDLMLEAEGALRTWRLSEPPNPDHAVVAEPIGDHRLMYLDYEGEVSGGRGRVKRIETGSFEWTVESPDRIEISVSDGRIVICDEKLVYERR